MMNNGKIGLAVVGGYLLGRTKKAKLALGLGMVLAGKRLDLSPQQLLKTLSNSPVVGGLTDQVRRELVDGTKSALTSAVTRRANSFADSLHERTLDINDPERGPDADDYDDRDDFDDDPRDEDVRDDDARDERDREERDGRRGRADREERPAPRRKAPAKTAKSGAATATSGSRAGGSARKTASSGARKTGGTGRTAAKTASGAARRTTKRGGGNG